jgi:hypothetical protein
MDFSTPDIRRFVRDIPSWLLLMAGFTTAGGFLAGFIVDFTTSPENTRLFLSTLAGAQAGILAIVFSVTVIGIQLVATRYSPRMISFFTESPVFIYTFFFFVVSIAVDLWLLLSVPSSESTFHNAGVLAASGLALSSAITLFAFVRTAIKQGTPDGAIDAFVSGMTTDRYLDEVKQRVESDSEVAHPMHPLYNLIMNSLSSGEYVTTKKAIDEYGNLTQNSLSDYIERQTFEVEERKVAKELFNPVLKEHLKEIALHAEEKEEHQIVSDAVGLQYELGETGLEISSDVVARGADFGLAGLIRAAPVETGSYISSNNAWKKIGELLVDASEKPNPEIVRNISSSIKRGVSTQIWKIDDARWYQHSMMHLYKSMENSQEALLNHYGEAVANVDMEWQYEHVPDDAPNREKVEAVHRWRNTLFSSSADFIEYLIREGEYPITEGNFMDNWKTICIDASNSPAEDYAITLCQAMIEIAVIMRNEIDESGTSWDLRIARVKHEGDPEIVNKAFGRLLEYETAEEEPWPAVVGEMDEYRKVFYENQLNVNSYAPLNSIPDFQSAVKRVQETADERQKKLESWESESE